jgi:MoaA/NifB/PqqE/SkfB family radical SAM enzyme
MGPTGGKSRVLQIHPTRRCNLRCLHCYSSSAPEEHDELPVALLRDALTDAAAERFNVAAFSGGEPILYKPLGGLLDYAHDCGFTTAVTSNGMLLDEPRVEMLRQRADVLAISLDGIPASHNQVRGSDRAFEAMASRLEGVRQAGIVFGFIFTLTQFNLNELEWVADFALEQGAKLLQIHPLEEIGRADQLMNGHRPDATECAYAFIEAARIQKMAGTRLFVQVDLSHRMFVGADPERVLAGHLKATASEMPLADLVSPLVIEPDGTVVPLAHGFSRQYALGNLHCGPLHELAVKWRRDVYSEFHSLAGRVFEEITTSSELRYFNWYELIGRRSMEPAFR